MTLSHFAYHSPYKNSERILEELEFWILRSVPNLIKVISLNPVNSGDSNSIIYVSIPVLGEQEPELSVSLFTCSPLEISSENRVVSYIVGKVWMRRLQRRWNRRKRFSNDGVIPRISLSRWILRGGLILGGCLGLLEGWNCDIRMPRMLP